MPTNNPQAQWEDYTTSGVTGLLGEAGFKEPEKYSKFISEYNPYKEIVAQKTYDTQMKQFGVQRDTLSKNYSNQLTGLLGQTESAQAKSGFASSGAINRASGQSRSNLGFEYMSGVKGLNLGKKQAATDLWSSVQGTRSDYINNLYEQMTQLIQGGAKTYENGDTKIDDDGNTWTYQDGKWILTGVPPNGPDSWLSGIGDDDTDDDDTGGGLVPGGYSLGGGDDNTDENGYPDPFN